MDENNAITTTDDAIQMLEGFHQLEDYLSCKDPLPGLPLWAIGLTIGECLNLVEVIWYRTQDKDVFPVHHYQVIDCLDLLAQQLDNITLSLERGFQRQKKGGSLRAEPGKPLFLVLLEKRTFSVESYLRQESPLKGIPYSALCKAVRRCFSLTVSVAACGKPAKEGYLGINHDALVGNLNLIEQQLRQIKQVIAHAQDSANVIPRSALGSLATAKA